MRQSHASSGQLILMEQGTQGSYFRLAFVYL